MEVYTTGFTKKTASQFFGSLKQVGIKRLVDVRLNNSSQLAGFAKKDDLPYFLNEICHIEYVYEPLLAPTQDMLDAYKKEKGNWSDYERRFLALMRERRVEENISPKLFEMPTVLLCSEATAEHCHRRLVVEYLHEKWGNIEIIHLQGEVMEIVVNHLTRMYPGYICVAGVNTSTWQHIRPVLNGRLSTSLLAANGGPFAMASHVDLGSVQYRGCPPEVEDYYFSSQNVRAIRILPSEEFWELLQHIARRSIVEIFGSAIRSYGKGCVVEVETGEASLGCLIPATQPKLFVNSFGSVRVGVTDGTFTLDLSVTDVRLCEVDHKTLKMGLINQINSRMQRGTPVILSIGLTRSWQKPGDTKEWHWLQVNNIHLKDSVV